jgi:RNA polymerase sigma factor (TIGR02999 family)
MKQVTRILWEIERGESGAAEALLPLVYHQLRRLAARRLAREKPGQTLQPTALVHEAYLRLVDADRAKNWNSRRHFYAAAAEAMRRILIDHARRKRAEKHGGDHRRVPLDDFPAAQEIPADDFLAVDDALARLAADHPKYAELVRLRYYAGLTIVEAAGVMGISRATAERYWTFARTWLYCELRPQDEMSQ